MTTQHEADRERIAGEMCKAQPGRWWVADEFHELGNAVRAFETLCKPKGWMWETLVYGKLDAGRFWLASGGKRDVRVDSTGNHAADVCRLVCEVLDREAQEPRHD